ncbi:hypothetical protein N9M34_00550 [Aquiluna sp.]|nr:hypothetical protein [Aquiluna sp.]
MSETGAALFVMWHKTVDRAYFSNFLANFNGDIIFLKAGTRQDSWQRFDAISDLSEGDLPDADLTLQKRGFMAGSMLLNVYASRLHEQFSHIGFMEYDIHFPTLRDGHATCELLNNCMISNEANQVVSLSTKRRMHELFAQEDIRINGINAVEWLFANLGKPTTPSFEELLERPAVTQQSFFTSSSHFETVMNPIHKLSVERAFESGLDTWHRPSTLFERAIAAQLALTASSMQVAPTTHSSAQNWSDRPTRYNWRRYIANYLRRK